MHRFGDIAFTSAVQHRQSIDGSRAHYAQQHDAPTGLGSDEQAFLRSADSLYLASVSETGWPYLQHRGGPVGFVHVLDDTTIAWLERSGNRQHVTAGNLDGDDRVAIFVMDYPNRARLKLLGHATRIDEPGDELLARLGGGRTTGLIRVEIEAFDWNCPKYITPRYTAEAVNAIVEPLQQRIRELEDRLGL
jgi:hypothetical protein